MERVIKIESFSGSLEKALLRHYEECRGVWICRFFECLKIGFYCNFAGRKRRVSADVLPRVNKSSLGFRVTVNIENENVETEQLLAQRITEFFTREYSGSDASAVSVPNEASFLFIPDDGTLALLIRS